MDITDKYKISKLWDNMILNSYNIKEDKNIIIFNQKNLKATLQRSYGYQYLSEYETEYEDMNVIETKKYHFYNRGDIITHAIIKAWDIQLMTLTDSSLEIENLLKEILPMISCRFIFSEDKNPSIGYYKGTNDFSKSITYEIKEEVLYLHAGIVIRRTDDPNRDELNPPKVKFIYQTRPSRTINS